MIADPTILQYLTGPAGTVVVLAAVLLVSVRILESRVLPALGRLVDRHFDQIDRLIASHDEDRRAWQQDTSHRRPPGEGRA